MNEKHLLICWFRRNLRLHDNELLAYTAQGCDLLLPLYILDPCQLSPENSSANRVGFLLDSLEDLDQGLKTKYNQRLFVTRGPPLQVLQHLIVHIRGKMKRVGRITLGFERDFESFGVLRDKAIKNWACQERIEVKTATQLSLFDLEDLYELGGWMVPKSMSEFEGLIKHHSGPPQPLEQPDTLPPPLKEMFFGYNMRNEILTYFGNVHFYENVPTLDKLNMGWQTSDKQTVFQGGESVALRRLNSFIKDDFNRHKFSINSNNPTHHHPPAATQSPYLSFGCLSPRLYFHSLKISSQKSKPEKQQSNSESEKDYLKKLIKNLYWREFFYMVGSFTKNFSQMYNNPVSKLTECWGYNPIYVSAWSKGKTGYPAIDAVMRQIEREGWTHDFNRHLVACFLTRGSMWQSWEMGMSHFRRKFIDYDWHLNTGTWIWLCNIDFKSEYTKVGFRIYPRF